MFNIGFGELMIVLLVAFLVVGPSDLPKVARLIAKLLREAREQWDIVMKELALESEIEEAKKAVKEIDKAIEESNPLKTARHEIEDISKSIQSAKLEAENQVGDLQPKN